MSLNLRKNQKGKLTIEQLDSNFEYLDNKSGGGGSGATGPQGPAGSAGPAGATGPQGPAGSGGSGSTGSYTIYGIDNGPIFSLNPSNPDYTPFQVPILQDSVGSVTFFGPGTSSVQLGDNGKGSTFSLEQTVLNGFIKDDIKYSQPIMYRHSSYQGSDQINISLEEMVVPFIVLNPK